MTCAENSLYKAILYHMLTSECDFKCVRQHSSTNLEIKNDVIKKNLDLILRDSVPVVVDIENNITVLPSSENCVTDKDKVIKSDILTVTSTVLTTAKLLDVLSQYQSEYFMYLKKYVDTGQPYFFKLSGYTTITTKTDTTPTTKHVEVWQKRDFRSFKTFDNVFFSRKQEIIDQINYFLTNELEYQRRGIAYNLNILLWGEPGCGKTSFIKALANMLKRHIVDVNLGAIDTCDNFNKIFNDDFIDDSYIPIDKRITILEDMDCMGNVLKPREEDDTEMTKEKTEVKDEDEDEAKDKAKAKPAQLDNLSTIMLANLLNDKPYKPYKKYDKMNLSCFLNTIDGTYEHHNRVIIATTNHLSKLDPAVLRRFDIKVEFTHVTQEIAQQIIDNYYGKRIKIPVLSIPYTGAHLTHLCQANSEFTISTVLK
jgi:GTPase SAR1 family protein